MNNRQKYVDKIITPGYIVPNNLCNTFAEDWFKLALLIIDALSGINRNLPPATFAQVCSMFSKALAIQNFSKDWVEIIIALSQNDIKKFEALINSPNLGELTFHKLSPQLKKLVIDDFLIHKESISKWLYRSLAPADQLLFDQLAKSSQSEIIAELDVLLNSFTIKNGLAYRKVKDNYSPYIYEGVSGLAYIVLYFCDKYDLTEQLEALKKFLAMLKGRYVKSANITGGAAGISLILIYAGIVTKSTDFLQLALSWDKYIDILSFKVRGKKVWCDGVLSYKYKSSLYSDAHEIQKFQQLIHDPRSYT